jgi:hypothetical protein
MSRKLTTIHLAGDSTPRPDPGYEPRSRAFDWMPLLLAGLALLGQVYMEATHNDKANAVAISRLEGHREDDNQRLNRIEDKVDEVLRALRTK